MAADTGNVPITTGSISEATSAFESLLTASNDGDVKAASQDLAPAEADEAPATEAETEATETPEESPPEGETEEVAEDEAAADEVETEETPPAEPQLLTVKINGKEEQVTLDEAAKGYQRWADYSQKTAALANQRREFEAEAQSVKQERAQYAQLLSALHQQVTQSQQKEPDWNALYQSDPLEYVRQKDVWRENQDKAQAAQYELQRLNQVQAQEQQQALAKLVEQGQKALADKFPEWRDPVTRKADVEKILAHGKKEGFTAEELEKTFDPRAVTVLRKAMLYDALTAKKPVPVQRTGPKPLAAGAAQAIPKANAKLDQAQKRLAKSGRVQDAASIFEQLV